MQTDLAHPPDGVSQLALFDLDNTLIDRQAAFRRWAEWFADEWGLGPEAVEQLCLLDEDGFASRQEVFTGARQHWRLPDSVDELIAGYRLSYPSFFVADGSVNQSLDRLRQAGIPVAVVTNGPPSQREKIERVGLDRRIDACCISEEVGAAKPSHQIFEAALTRLGLDQGGPTHVTMVGDSPLADIGGARDMGFRTIWMSRGRRWDVDGFQPDAAVATVAEAVDLILGTTTQTSA